MLRLHKSPSQFHTTTIRRLMKLIMKNGRLNRKAIIAIAFALSLVTVCHESLYAQKSIQLDGEFHDWTQVDPAASDPIGDATGVFDLSRVSSFVDGKTIYLRFDTQTPLNLQSGPETEGTLRLRIDLSPDRRLVVDFRQRQAMLTTKNAARTVPWKEIRFTALPTYASTDFELRLDLRGLGIREGEEVQIQFEGSDQLVKPIRLTMGEEVTRPLDPSDLTKPSKSLRVASLNTLRQGIAVPERAPSIRSLFEFADADIYCFNESLDERTFRESCLKVVPQTLAETKHIHWASTCGIVSRFPLTPLAFRCREAAALIQVPDERPLVVVSVHFKCCGFAGSTEDRRRIEEVEALLSDLERMRQGEFGVEAADAGVIVIGDFNLVGSRKPLDMINKAGLKDVMLTCPVDGSAMTWHGIRPTESFWPGRLDYVTLDEARVKSTGGFIMDSEQLGQLDADLATDVPASDHSMLVVDLELL